MLWSYCHNIAAHTGGSIKLAQLKYPTSPAPTVAPVVLNSVLLLKSVKSLVYCTPSPSDDWLSPGPGGLGLQPSLGCSAASSKWPRREAGWQQCWELSWPPCSLALMRIIPPTWWSLWFSRYRRWCQANTECPIHWQRNVSLPWMLASCNHYV